MSTVAPTQTTRPLPGQLLFWTLLLAVGLLLIYPLYSLLLTSFQTNVFGQETIYGIDNWRRIFSQPRMLNAIWNTVLLGLTRQLIAVVIGVAIAWAIARTNLPGRRWLEVGFWIALFMPPLPVTLGWVYLIGGRSGLLNQWLMQLPFVDAPVFEAYSWWGIIWVHLVTSTIAIKVFLLVPAFRTMDSSLEEAARASGASLPRMLIKVVAPLMAPIIAVVFLIGIVRSMQAFEVELILGAPKRIDVYSTIIYRTMNLEPPQHGTASALSILFFLSIIPFVLLQQYYAQGRQYGLVSGKFQSRLQDLGSWRWPLFGAIVGLLTIMTIVPFAFLLVSTFMKVFGSFDLDAPWTIDNWAHAFTSGDIARSMWNSIQLGVIAALAGMILFTVIAYLTVRRHDLPARALDFFTWVPTLIPGLVLSLGLLQMFTGLAIFRPVYGTMFVLVIAILIATMTIGTQIIRGSIRTLGRDMEEAAWAAGGSRFYTFHRVVLPLIAPSIAVIGLEIFATANSAIGIIILLGTGSTQPLSILQLVLLDSGRFESGAVVGIVIMVLTVSAALLARWIGNRAGLGRHERNA